MRSSKLLNTPVPNSTQSRLHLTALLRDPLDRRLAAGEGLGQFFEIFLQAGSQAFQSCSGPARDGRSY
jgi:hypothetical protein